MILKFLLESLDVRPYHLAKKIQSKDLTSLVFSFLRKHGRFTEGVKMVNGGHVWYGKSRGFVYQKIVRNLF